MPWICDKYYAYIARVSFGSFISRNNQQVQSATATDLRYSDITALDAEPPDSSSTEEPRQKKAPVSPASSPPEKQGNPAVASVISGEGDPPREQPCRRCPRMEGNCNSRWNLRHRHTPGKAQPAPLEYRRRSPRHGRGAGASSAAPTVDSPPSRPRPIRHCKAEETIRIIADQPLRHIPQQEAVIKGKVEPEGATSPRTTSAQPERRPQKLPYVAWRYPRGTSRQDVFWSRGGVCSEVILSQRLPISPEKHSPAKHAAIASNTPRSIRSTDNTRIGASDRI